MTSSTLHTRPLPSTAGDDAPIVVFLHGLFGQGKNFATVAKALSDTYAPVLVDLPNHGRSPHTEVFDYQAMADAVADTIRRDISPDGTPVHVVGHSMGGKVAMLLALAHPELVNRLVVEDISPVETAGTGEFDQLLTHLRELDLSTLTSRDEADQRLADDIHDEGVRAFLLQNLRRTDDGWGWLANLDLLHRDLEIIGGFPALDTQFTGRVLWMGATESPYVRDEHEPAMEALFPSTLRVMIKGANHWIHSVAPDAFVSALRTFFSAADD